MIDVILENALNVRVDGVTEVFLTPRGNVAGQFFSDDYFVDFEIEDDDVYYMDSEDLEEYQYHMDAGGQRGKKCPGGYWIPRNKECKRGTMSPSASKKSGMVKGALAAGLIGAAGAGLAMRNASQQKQRRVNINRAGAAVAGGAALAGAAAGGVAGYRRHSENKVMNTAKKWGPEISREQARKEIDTVKAANKKMKGQMKEKYRANEDKIYKAEDQAYAQFKGGKNKEKRNEALKQYGELRKRTKEGYKSQQKKLKQATRNRFKELGL